MQISSRALLALVPLAILPPTRLAPAVLDGYVVTYSISGEHPSNAPTSFTVKFAGDKMRMEADLGSMMGGSGGGGAMVEGIYMLPQSNGKFVVVMPQMKMAMSMDVSGMGARGRGAAAVEAACASQPKIDDLGAAETVAGHPTRKYRVTSKDAKGDEVAEIWVATDMKGVENVFVKMGERFGGQFGVDSKCVKDALGTMSGFPVKLVMTDEGKTMTLEAVRAEKVSFNEGEFEIPPGVQVMDGASMMRGRGRGGE